MKAFLNNNGQIVKRVMINKQKSAYWAHASLIVLHFTGLDLHNSFEIFDEPPGSAQAELEEPTKKAKNPPKQPKQNKIDIYMDDAENEDDEKPKPKPKIKPVNLKRLNSSVDRSDLQIESSYFGNKAATQAAPEIPSKKRKLALNSLDSFVYSGIKK